MKSRKITNNFTKLINTQRNSLQFKILAFKNIDYGISVRMTCSTSLELRLRIRNYKYIHISAFSTHAGVQSFTI